MPRTSSAMIAQRLDEAIEWYFDNQDPEDSATITATARIFNLKINTLRKAIQRHSTPTKGSKQGKGQPPFLKPHQIDALCSHITTQAYDGNPLNKAMLMRAAKHLHGTDKEPSENEIRKENIYNMNETEFRISVVEEDYMKVPFKTEIIQHAFRDSVDLTRAKQAVTLSAWKHFSEAKARSRKRVTRSKDGKNLFDLRELIEVKKREEEEALEKQAKTLEKKQESMLQKLYLEDLKAWKAKEKECKAAIACITKYKKNRFHLVPTELLLETPNKPIDPATIRRSITLVDDEDIDIILKRDSGRLNSVIDDHIAETSTPTVQLEQETGVTKPSWMDLDFIEFE
ncbi:hypothetical protein B7463_g11456, partial [Scytalidium lignicola]